MLIGLRVKYSLFSPDTSGPKVGTQCVVYYWWFFSDIDIWL